MAIAIVAGAALLVRRRPSVQTPPRPEDQLDRCITQMLQAAQNGDVKDYLECFAGDLRAKLASRLERAAPEVAAAELRSGYADLKSYVTTDWQRLSDDEATLTLERVYKDYNERHRVRLRWSRTGWKIVELTPLESFAPEIPYGTPVFQLPEAGGESTQAREFPSERPAKPASAAEP